jgi:hypothetical protein
MSPCLTPPFHLSDETAAGATWKPIDDFRSPRRRILVLVSCLCATVLALYSCSMRRVTTDGNGRIVDVSSLRVESSLARVAVAMLVAGGQVALECAGCAA